jgi:hypothetical protein
MRAGGGCVTAIRLRPRALSSVNVFPSLSAGCVFRAPPTKVWHLTCNLPVWELLIDASCDPGLEWACVTGLRRGQHHRPARYRGWAGEGANRGEACRPPARLESEIPCRATRRCVDLRRHLSAIGRDVRCCGYVGGVVGGRAAGGGRSGLSERSAAQPDLHHARLLWSAAAGAPSEPLSRRRTGTRRGTPKTRADSPLIASAHRKQMK